MEIPNLNNEVTSKNIEAIHLLSEIDVKSVENYASKLLRLHHIKKSQFTAECVICTSPLFKNWQNLVEHLRNPSHIDNIKEDSKQFTAFCIVCKYIVITDDADFIFEHFILHKPKTYKKSCSVNKNLTDKDVFSPVSHNGDKKSSIISSNATTSVKDSTGIHNSLKGGKLVKENHPNSIHLINNTVNIDNYDDGIIDQDKLGVNSIKTSSNRSIPTSSKKLVCSSSIGVLLPLQKDINPNESVKIISSQNSIPESSGKHFDPKKAFFSNTTLQLTSPGVSKDEFNTIGELNAENISDFCTKTYYSSYYRLRKLCYSCLECKALKLTENEFYKHINRIKHYNKFTEFNGIGFIKICDICQVLLLGHMNLIEDHFQCFSHNQNVKCRMGLIKQQYAVKSGEVKLGFSGELSDKCTNFFSSKEVLNRWVELSLKEVKYVASMAGLLCRMLESDIDETLKEKHTNFCVKIVGSRLYELANHESDVDIHLEIGDVSVAYLEKYFYRGKLFEVQRTIINAKVPIIRLKHLKSSLICDINTTNRAGPYCSELIKLYINLDDRVRWLAVAIMEWSAENDIRGARKFKSYALMCLVLFFLMSPQIRLIPSVHELKLLYEGTRVYIKGWDYSFCRDIDKIKQICNPSLCNLNNYELLAGFFKYYMNLDAKGSVLFPHNGQVYSKNMFANPILNRHLGIFSNLQDDEPLSVGGVFTVIDFFCLRENLNKSVDENLLDHFKSICHKTLLCGWQN